MSRIQQLKGKFLEAEKSNGSDSKPSFGQSQLRSFRTFKDSAKPSEQKSSETPRNTIDRSKLLSKGNDDPKHSNQREASVSKPTPPSSGKTSNSSAHVEKMPDITTKTPNRPKIPVFKEETGKAHTAGQSVCASQSNIGHNAQTDAAAKSLQETKALKDRIRALELENSKLLSRSHTSHSESTQISSQANEKEATITDLRNENAYLKDELRTLQEEMDEVQDQFKEEDEQEFRDLQKEFETMAKNYRITQFKLKKAERKIDQSEIEKQQNEERMHQLHASNEESGDRNLIRDLEQELQMSKEVSIRLHSEIENLEEKSSKLETENERYVEELQQSESKRKQMEKDIQRLQLALEDTRAASGSPMVTIPPSKIGDSHGRSSPTSLQVPDHARHASRQVSQDHDISQVMRDLYDSMEREQDMKEQLKFSEEEARIIRRKLADLENENDSLIAQLKKMSGKAPTPSYKKRSLSKERGRKSDSEDDEGSDSDFKLQVELAEQEHNVLRKRINELSSENENLLDEVKFLQEKLRDGCQEEGSHRSAADLEHYDAAMRVMVEEMEELKWKLIEKDRELELARIIKTKQSDGAGETAADRRGSLVRSRSVENEGQPGTGITIKQQLELLHEQAVVLKERNEVLQTENEQLKVDNEYLQSAIENDDRIHEDDRSPNELKSIITNLKEDIGDLQILVKSRENEISSLEQQKVAYECELDDIKRSSELAEIGYKEEIESLMKKNETLSNCLKMVGQRTGLDQKQRSELIAAGQRDLYQPATNGASEAPAIGKNWDDSFNKQLQTLRSILEVERPHEVTTKVMSGGTILRRSGGVMEDKESWETELQECISHLQDASNNINSIGERLRHLVDAYESRSRDQRSVMPRESENKRTEQIRDDVREMTKTCSKYKQLMEKLQGKLEQVIRCFSSLQVSWDREKARMMDDVHDNVNLARQVKQKLLEKEGLLKSRERQLEQINKEINDYKSEIRENEKKLKGEKDALVHNAKLLESLDHEVKKLEGILRNKNIEIYEKDETCRLLRKDCKTRDETVKQKTDEMKELAKKLHAFEGKIIAYVSQVGSLEQKLKQKEFELSKNEKVTKALKENLDKEQLKMDNLLKKQTNEKSSLEGEKNKINKECVSLKERCNLLESDIKKQKDTLIQERTSRAKEKQSLQLELVTLREQVSLIERSKTMKESERVDVLSSEKQDLQRYKTKLEGEVEQLKRDIDHIEECNAFEKDELQTLIAEKVEIIRSMRDNENEHQKRVDDLQKKVIEQSKELQKARTKLLEHGDDDLRAMQSAQIRKLRQEKSDMRKQYLLEMEMHEDSKHEFVKLKAGFEQERNTLAFERELLSKQIYEAKDKRTQVITLQKMVENLKTKLQESENAKEDLLLMHSTERLGWEVGVAELQARINKLEEQKPLPRFPIKAKDKRKAELENNWEKERSELRRIVAEAHAITINQKQKMDGIKSGETLNSLVEERLLKEEEIHKRELSVHEATIRELHQKLNSLLGLKMELAETKTRFKREDASWDLEKQKIQASVDEAREQQRETHEIVDQFIIKLKCLYDEDIGSSSETLTPIKQMIKDLEARRRQEKSIPKLEIKTSSRLNSQERLSNGSLTKYPVFSPLKAPAPKYPEPPPSMVFSRSSQSSSPSPRASYMSKTSSGLIKGLAVDTPSSAKLWTTIDDWKNPISEKHSPSRCEGSDQQRTNGEVSITLTPPASAGRPSTLPLTKSARPSGELRRLAESSSKGDFTKPSPTTARKKFLENFLSINFGKKSRKDYSGDTQSERGRSESPAPVPKPPKSKSKKLLQKSHSLDESTMPSPSYVQVQKPTEKTKEAPKSSRKLFQRSSSLEAAAPPQPDTPTQSGLRKFASEEDLTSRKGKPSLFKRFKMGLKK